MKVEKTVIKRLPTHSLCLDKSVQMREYVNQGVVSDYAELLTDPDFPGFPPVVVFWRFGSKYYVADGWHRVLAHNKAAVPQVLCEVRDGSKRDAIMYAAGANANHGLRRSRQEKRRAVIALLKDEEWGAWSSAEIARKCNVSASLVESIRTMLVPPRERKRSRKVMRNGKVINYTVPKPTYERPEPENETPVNRCDGLIGDSEVTYCPTCGRPYSVDRTTED